MSTLKTLKALWNVFKVDPKVGPNLTHFENVLQSALIWFQSADFFQSAWQQSPNPPLPTCFQTKIKLFTIFKRSKCHNWFFLY